MSKIHFKLTSETTQTSCGRALYRIQATETFKNRNIEIKKGTKGGFVGSLDNLSDTAWVSGDAQVCGSALVSGNARVCGNALVSGNARVYENALVYGYGIVSENARVAGHAQV
jgi:hypothetical protein